MSTMQTIDVTAMPEVLKGKIVAEEDRLDFWPTMFHSHIMEAMEFERIIFTTAERQTSDYQSGYWEFVILDAEQKIYYIYPLENKNLTVNGFMNGSTSVMSPELFGLLTTMICLAWLGDADGNKGYHEAYRKLYAFTQKKLHEVYLPYDDVAESEWPEEVAQAANTLSIMHQFLD